MLKDYTGNLKTDANMKILPEGSHARFGLGCWIFDFDSLNNPTEFSSPGYLGFTPWIDTKRN